MKKKLTLLVAIFGFVMSYQIHGAEIVEYLVDSFDANITDDGGDPLDAEWSFHGSTGTLAFSSDEGGVLDLSSPKPYVNTGAEMTRGDSITIDAATPRMGFSFRVRATSDPDTVSRDGGFRFALMSSSGLGYSSGYLFWLNWGNGGTSVDGIYDPSQNYSLTGNLLQSGGGAYDMTGTDWHTVSGEISYVDATHLKFTLGLDGTSHISSVVIEDTTPVFSFNKMIIATNGQASPVPFRIDDIYIATIPEPASGLLLVVGMVLSRRRRTSPASVR